MSSYILFLILGLGSGATFAILGQGLVLKYRSAGVVDFAHGAVAMFIAYVFVNLRSYGELELPVVIIPHQISLNGGTGINTALAIVVSLVYAAILGLVLYVLVYRPLRTATPLTRICASVGVMLGLQAVAVLNYSTEAVATNPIFPSSPLSVFGLAFPEDRLFFTGVVLVISVTLALVYRYTRFGLATRAGAENDRGAALTGISANRVATQNWVIATVLAGAAGIMIAPVANLDPTSYTLFVVPALAAALLGRFESFWITALAALAIGCFQSELEKLITVWTWLPQQGLPDAIPFLVIIVVMTLRSRAVLARGGDSVQRNPSVGRPRTPLRTAAICFVAGLVLMVLLGNVLRFAFISSLTVTCIALSLVVLTGTAYFAHSARLMGEIAAVTGRDADADAARYRALAGTHLATGFLSTGQLLGVLADAGNLDVAYALLFADTVPSWLAMIDRGATTLWERWNGIDAHGVPYESLNHYSRGAVIGFLHRHVAGIQLLDGHPGYRRFRIAPHPGGPLTWARGAHDSPYGRIESAWRIDGDELELSVTVPPGTTAELAAPGAPALELGPGRHTLRSPRAAS
jgi:branched-subunit amino acid ABC-type transport system permease component